MDLRLLVEEVIGLLGRSIDKNIEIVPPTPGPAANATGDPALIQSALLNLGLNARDAMPSGGTLAYDLDHRSLDEEACERIGGGLEPGRYIVVSVAQGPDVPAMLVALALPE